jgi:hypothetical protein
MILAELLTESDDDRSTSRLVDLLRRRQGWIAGDRFLQRTWQLSGEESDGLVSGWASIFTDPQRPPSLVLSFDAPVSVRDQFHGLLGDAVVLERDHLVRLQRGTWQQLGEVLTTISARLGSTGRVDHAANAEELAAGAVHLGWTPASSSFQRYGPGATRIHISAMTRSAPRPAGASFNFFGHLAPRSAGSQKLLREVHRFLIGRGYSHYELSRVVIACGKFIPHATAEDVATEADLLERQLVALCDHGRVR